jgi:hypothetical protein
VNVKQQKLLPVENAGAELSIDRTIQNYRRLGCGIGDFIEMALRDGELKETGTDFDMIMPPLSRFGGGDRDARKQGIIEKLRAFFVKCLGLV